LLGAYGLPGLSSISRLVQAYARLRALEPEIKGGHAVAGFLNRSTRTFLPPNPVAAPAPAGLMRWAGADFRH